MSYLADRDFVFSVNGSRVILKDANNDYINASYVDVSWTSFASFFFSLFKSTCLRQRGTLLALRIDTRKLNWRENVWTNGAQLVNKNKVNKMCFLGRKSYGTLRVRRLLKNAFAEVPWKMLSISVILTINFIRNNTIKRYSSDNRMPRLKGRCKVLINCRFHAMIFSPKLPDIS